MLCFGENKKIFGEKLYKEKIKQGQKDKDKKMYGI